MTQSPDDPVEDDKIRMALAEIVANPDDYIGVEWTDDAGYLVWKAREVAHAYPTPICWTCFEDENRGADDCCATERGEVNCLL